MIKRSLIFVATLIAVIAGVDVLGDLTQDRADHVPPDSRSEIILKVASRDRTGSALMSTRGLWGACQGTVRHRLVEPGVIDLGDGRFRVVTEPALGEHSWRRLQGCLEDVTLERVKGHVVSKRDFDSRVEAASPNP